MRNLKLVSNLHCHVEGVQDIQCISVDPDTGTVYVATRQSLQAIQPHDGQVCGSASLSEVVELVETTCVIAVQYLADEHSLCAATNQGDLILWNVLSGELECVGSVESGITSMTWSPDLEVLVITTGVETFILMTREFDPVTESSLHPEKFGEAEFVQVGWGKKETQFHGSIGKSAAQAKVEDVKPVQSWDDRQPRVTWRGDGQYFSIGAISPVTGARKICVWTRECVHHSSSENVDGVEQALSWRPSGSLIATSQRRPNRHDIAFFERNGLRHGEFTLPFTVNEVKVREVLWNLDSTVLAVWCESLEEPLNTYVQLWTMGNYHWYLKQSLHFSTGPNQRIAGMVWDPEQAYRLHVVQGTGEYHQYTWCWATNHSSGRTAGDQALTAVIDGAKLLMTPMRHMVVPPPMSAYQLELPAAVNQVVFAPPPHSNDLSVVLVDGRIALYRFADTNESGKDVKLMAAGGAGFNRCCQLPSLQTVYSLPDLGVDTNCPLSISHITWVTVDTIIFSTVTMGTQPHSVLHKVKMEGDKLAIMHSLPIESCILGMAVDSDTQCMAVQLTDGSILKYIPEEDLALPWETSGGDELRFPVPCTQMAVCEVGGEVVVLGLTERYRFYVNKLEVASNCTSFSVHDEFLLLTTLTHTCRCISRHTKVKDLPTLSDGKAHPFDESVRRVERGSRIVTSVADDTRLVLQMPRGNLETIHPRALVLSAVRKHLYKKQFNAAFMIMKKHRINMNLLYDHDPALFVENVDMFVRQVDSVSHINLFLTDLIEEDVTVTMYTAAYERNLLGGENSTVVERETSKVDIICDKVRQALISIDENKYLLSILTTYVRKSKPELEQALQLVEKLRDTQTSSPHISAEEVLKYLLFLVDVNEMYDIALGTYDFSLVMMVAEKSQKDPKEYIPFLNQLRKLGTFYQHYTIDKHLKRYSKALENISKCGSDHFNECISLVAEHNLHTEALCLYEPGSHEYKEIAGSYGDLLSGKRRHEEAAVYYVKAEQWSEALESYQACVNWQQVFCMTSRLGYTTEQVVEIARKVAVELESKGRHGDAAVVLEQYARDIEEAIVTLVHGCLWDEALRLMYKNQRTDFIETDLKVQLMESWESHMSSLDQSREKFEKHKARLLVVRQEKEKARLEFLEGGGDHAHDSDLFSDTSSATGESTASSRYSADTTSSSVYSKMSGRSVRNRRKAEHKKWRLKEGSEFEDFALIAALAKTVSYIDSLREEVKAILRCLVQFHYDKQASELQKKYDSFLVLIDQSVPQIWVDEDSEQQVKHVLGPNTTANTIALAVQQGKTVSTESQETVDPVIKVAPIIRKDTRWKLYALET